MSIHYIENKEIVVKRSQTAVIAGLVVANAVALALGACSGPATPGPTSTTTSPAASSRPATAAPSPTITATATASAAWSTADVTQAFTGQVPPVPTLTGLRIGAHPESGYDRIALDFQQAKAPGYTARYVPAVIRDGSGQNVTLTGGAFLQIVFNPAAAHNDAGQVTLSNAPTSPVNTGFAGLQSYVMNGDFEGHVSIALGQATKAGFQITQIQQPSGYWTIAIDVRRP